ncbi:hypothetical protein GJU43_14955 [Flavobacterium sp. LC2016-23]|uniref:hypothetical protein n=1 Tax=Flavobacterium sp. LC2016-23 TaxID=2666330 RepID=UPI0012AEF189|nr:hypothetical protein [Flavobacterium sp. LC2016-23]MRX40586.1 hypothetical protein [Flavobacterium sp. LC2016-23]
MLDYIETVTDFLIENFHPSNPESANIKLNTDQILNFLFRTFPAGCISDYDLNEILISLNYKRYTYVVESYCEIEKGESTIYEIRKNLEVGWCLKTDLNLKSQEVEKLE